MSLNAGSSSDCSRSPAISTPRVWLANGDPEVGPNNAVSVISEQCGLRWNTPGPAHLLSTIRGGSELDTDSFPEIYKRVEVYSLVSSAAVQLTPVLLSYLPNFRPGAVVISSSSSCSSKLFSPSSPSGFYLSAP